MEHCALSLNYSYNQENESNSVITEHFIPYSIEELTRLGFEGKVGEALKEISQTYFQEEYPLDTLYDDYRDEIIREELSIRVIDEEESGYLFEEEAESVFKTSAWDLISDAGLIKYVSDTIREYGKERMSQIEALAEITFVSQVELFSLKIAFSLLTHLEYALNREIRNLRELNVDINRSFEDINFYRRTKGVLENRTISNRIFEEFFQKNVEEFRGTNDNQVYDLERRIRTLMSFNMDERTDPEQIEANWMAIGDLNRELGKAIRKPYEKACFFYEVINGIHDNRIVKRIRQSVSSLNTFLNERFDRYSVSGPNWSTNALRNTIAYLNDHVLSFSRHSKAVSLNNYYGASHFSDLNDYISSGTITKYIKDRYRDGSGCFAILITNSNKHYFSLSGVAEELKHGAGKLAKPVKYIMEEILNKCSVPNIYAHVYEYNYAYIDTDLEVRRYTEIVKDGTDYIGQIGPYISSPETYKDDYSHDPTEDYNRTYSCCERKMLAYSGYSDVKYIFSRWAPCWKCCPAILDANGVRVFAFSTLQEGKPLECKLDEYEVKCDRAYSVVKKVRII